MCNVFMTPFVNTMSGKPKVSDPGQSIVEKDKQIGQLTTKIKNQAAELTQLKNDQAANNKVVADGKAAVQELKKAEEANKQLELNLEQSQKRVEEWMDATGKLREQYVKLEQDYHDKIYQALNEGIEVGYWTGLRHSQHEHAIRIVNQFCGKLYDGSDITTAKRKPITDKSVDELIKKCEASKAEWQHKLGEFQELFESAEGITEEIHDQAVQKEEVKRLKEAMAKAEADLAKNRKAVFS